MSTPGAPDHSVTPEGEPPTVEDQRGELQPADAGASEEAQQMADAVEDPVEDPEPPG